MSDKKIQINYISEKIEKSPIMLKIWDTITIESKKEIEDIKNSIIGILECTTLENELLKNSWRNVYELNEDITKHLLSIISKDFSQEEKKNILKIKIKKLLQKKYNIDNDIIVFVRNNKIFILDIWKKLIENNKEKYDIKNKRFDWHTEKEIEAIIETKIWKNFNPREFIINILNEIDLSKLNIKQALDYLTKNYKIDLINKISLNLKEKFQLEDFLLKGISGKILRDNFQIAKNHITKLFFEFFFIKNIENNKVLNLNKIYNEIFDKYLNIEKLNIEKIIDFNIKNIYKIFIEVSSKEIGNFFSNLYNWYKLDNEQEKIFLSEYLKINKLKKEEIIEKLILLFVDNIFNVIWNDNSKNKSKLVYFFRQIDSKNIEIEIIQLEWYYTMWDLSNKIKQLLKSKKILETENKKLKTESEQIENSKENSKTFLNMIKNKLNNNLKQIKEFFNKKANKKNITISEVNAEILRTKNNLAKEKLKFKKYQANTLKKVINSTEISKLKRNIEKLEKKLAKINEVYFLIKENDKLKRNIEKIEKNLNRLEKIKKQIKINNSKIAKINFTIDNIKIFFINVIKKHFL